MAEEEEETSAVEAEAQEEQPPARRRLMRLAITILAIVVAIGGLWYYIYARNHESTDDAYIAGHLIQISPRVAAHVAVVHVTDNQWVKAGDLLVELAPEDFKAALDAAEANLAAAESTFRSSAIDVELTTVTAVSADDEARAAVDTEQAALKTAEAQCSATASQCEQARAQVDLARAALQQAEAEAASAKAQEDLDSIDLVRKRQLATTGAVSQDDLDRAVAAERKSAAALAAAEKKVQTQEAMLRQSQAGLQAAEDNLRQSQAQIAEHRAQVEQALARLRAAHIAPQRVAKSVSDANVAQAQIDKARAEVEMARLNLSYTKIYAPADGHVASKSVEPGAYVQVGQPLLTIVPAEVWVVANFKETQLTHMLPGQPVSISVDTYPGARFAGHVDSVQRGTGAVFSLLPPENATGNFVKVVQRVPVKIVFDNPEDWEKYLLAPGMSVVPNVNIGAKPVEHPVRRTLAVAAPTPTAESFVMPSRAPHTGVPAMPTPAAASVALSGNTTNR
jgi:membrane fusion protein (multidrug efflux system)